MRVSRRPGLPRDFRFSDHVDEPLALRPLGPFGGAAAAAAVESGRAEWLCGPPLAFAAADVLLAGADGTLTVAIGTLPEIQNWGDEAGEPLRGMVAGAIERLNAPRRPFAGIALDRPSIAGVVNITTDSFHDGGAHPTADAAIAHGRAMAAAGADLIDVGGESTRPGSDVVPEALELERVIPVVAALARDGIAVSVDTRRPAVMRAAISAGARVVNDVTALSAPGAVEVVAETGAAAILMHMQGTPATMQNAPRYDHAPWEVYRFLAARVAACEAAGISRARLAVDPGIGFGKDLGHNLALIDSFALLHGLGCAVMAGVSRKSFIGRISAGAPAAARLPGTLAATALAVAQGVQIHRVHDAAEAAQALAVCRAVATCG